MAKTKTGMDGAGAPKSKTRKQATSTNHIRDWRLFKGLELQKDLAALTPLHDPAGVGLTSQTICRLENGELPFSQRTLAILSGALGVAQRDLIGTNPFDAGDIFAVYASLPEAEKRKALKMVAALKRS